jgi:type IV secretory pathway TrbD component
MDHHVDWVDWLLHHIARVLVILLALWVVAVIGLGLMVVAALIYHWIVPSCPDVFCF